MRDILYATQLVYYLRNTTDHIYVGTEVRKPKKSSKKRRRPKPR